MKLKLLLRRNCYQEFHKIILNQKMIWSMIMKLLEIRLNKSRQDLKIETIKI